MYLTGFRENEQFRHPGLYPGEDLIEGLKPEELSWILEIIPDKQEAQIFEYFPLDVQRSLALGNALFDLQQRGFNGNRGRRLGRQTGQLAAVH